MNPAQRLSQAVTCSVPPVPSFEVTGPAVHFADRPAERPINRAAGRPTNPPASRPADRPIGGGMMTLKDVAAELRVSVRTIKRLVESDGFPRPVRFGAAHRVARSEFDAYVVRKMDQRGREQAR